MEVVACFLQKYFSLLADNEAQSVKDLYAKDALVSLSVNGESESNDGQDTVDKVVTYFADGVVTLNNVTKVSGDESVVIESNGFVTIDGSETTFTQRVTLAHVAKHWFIIADQLNIVVPAPEPEAEEEPEEQVEEETEVEEKQPTPHRSPAIKPTAAAVEVPEVPVADKTAPKNADVRVKPDPSSAPTNATSWAALASSSAAKPAERLKVVISNGPVVAPGPVVATTKASEVGDNIYFSIPFNPTYNKEHITNETFAQIEACGINRRDITSLRVNINETKRTINVFVDSKIDGVIDKLSQLHIFGLRVTPSHQRK